MKKNILPKCNTYRVWVLPQEDHFQEKIIEAPDKRCMAKIICERFYPDFKVFGFTSQGQMYKAVRLIRPREVFGYDYEEIQFKLVETNET